MAMNMHLEETPSIITEHLSTICVGGLKAALTWIFATHAAFAAGPPQWTWEAGKQTNNGAITVKSVAGATTYTGTQNPTGAVAKANQNAVTQPPTIVIQATGAANPDLDNCWYMYQPGLYDYRMIGHGTVSGTQFTGVLTGDWGVNWPGPQAVWSSILGGSVGGGSVAIRVGTFPGYYNYSDIGVVKNKTIEMPSKCFP